MTKVVTTRSAANPRSTRVVPADSDPPFENMVRIPGGTFLMGSDRHYPEEAPVHKETVSGFWMETHLVTNADFARFVEATGYVTVAERVPDAAQYPGALAHMLVAGSVVFRKPNLRVDLRNHFHWWTYVPGANWRHPHWMSRGADSPTSGYRNLSSGVSPHCPSQGGAAAVTQLTATYPGRLG